MKKSFLLLIIVLLPFYGISQPAPQPSAAQIKLRLKKLNFLGSVLYVAAHPDDENTRIITYLANDRLASAAYLSMTRGDGGQNLIGPEIGDLLGLIRTQELLTARRIDGGQQFFTRANDFGFSKSADETLTIWGKDEILHDVVRVFREYQPDVIITRFPADERAGHGHHTASAMLAQEAFDVAAKPDAFPALAKTFGTWQVKRLYTNTGRWWNNTINENTPGITTLNVGGYSALLGQSYAEIASVSRSQHKSQGFGSAGQRGDILEFLEHVKGEPALKDIFEGVNTTWTRVKGGAKVQPLVVRAIQEFNEENPAAIVPALLAIRKEVSSLEDNVWKNRKLAEVEQLIRDCMGLYIEVTANEYWAAPGETLQLTVELVNRSSSEVVIHQISSAAVGLDTTLALPLKNNISSVVKTRKQLALNAAYSDPYWLRNPHAKGLFTVEDKNLIGKPENDPAVTITFRVAVGGEQLEFKRNLFYRWTDPVKGELIRPFEVVPKVFVNLYDDVIVFKDGNPKDVRVLIKSAASAPFTGNLKLDLPQGWTTEPSAILFSITRKGEEQIKSFRVIPSSGEMTGALKAVAIVDDKQFDEAIKVISYDHIPIQTLLPKAQAKLVRLNLNNGTGRIGYIKGAGDDVPAALRNIGYDVWELKNEEVTPENLRQLDAVVLGIRAINTNERIGFIMDNLLDYVKNGGTMIVQYNTNFDLEAKTFAPYPLTLSRERVTEEDAEVRILKPDHRVLNYPNKITQADFNGWVQERGLYFPNKWDSNYEAILAMNDRGEPSRDGSLLIAKYGTGHYVYTGLSFFRELPEGVAGAYKLFSNLVSLGKREKPEPVSSGKKKKQQNP